MEDMARLALIEQSVKNADKFSNILYELMRYIQNILENPHDLDLRTIKSNVIKEVDKFESFRDYMKYVGFQSKEDIFIYPTELPLNNLRMAQVAIQRKIGFCCGSFDESRLRSNSQGFQLTKKNDLKPSNILTTTNPLLLKIEHKFNNMLVYEDEELQALAREHIPIVTLQLMALDRVREQQRKLKTGEIKGHDLPFDMALLMELLGWFKHKFFTWVDRPACELCGGPTVFTEKVPTVVGTETCHLELYKCTVCREGRGRFPRHNDPRVLLRTRRGRCGEWANCFTLLCRSLGYDTRYVSDTSDHVWCEVFDYDSRMWVHVDPCEAAFNAPLSYEHGWGKRLAYVIAVSRDDLQDVTWRYTLDHKETLKRRTACEESELISAILSLRSHRQSQVSEARRRYLSKRNVEELVQMMVERSPNDYECHGRISGSREWRTTRGEIGSSGHVFEFRDVGRHVVGYQPVADTYRVMSNARETTVHTWSSGTFSAKCMFRKVEQDWRQVYLARQEDEPTGSISWKISAAPALKISTILIRVSTALYEDGAVQWTMSFDDGPPKPVALGESPQRIEGCFGSVVIAATLSGGRGHHAWQHAQLFRQGLDQDNSAFEIIATVNTR